MLTNIRLYGDLADKYGKEFRFDIDSPKDGIAALVANFSTFRETMQGENKYYAVVYEEESLGLDGLVLKKFETTGTLKIIPVIRGSGDSAIGKIIIGALIIYAATLIPGSSATFMQLLSGAETVSFAQTAMVYLGKSVMMAGVTQALAPTPGTATNADKVENYHFNGPVNTTKQGSPVPIAYGQLLVGGAVISAQIVAQDRTTLQDNS